MRSWQWAVCCLALLAAAGCRVDNSSAVSLLEQENGQLEAKVFELAGLVKDCRRENDRLRRRLGEDDRDAPIDGPRLDPSGSAARDTEPPDDHPIPLESPAIEVPGEEIPAEEFIKRFSEPKRLVPPDESPTFPDEEAPRWPSSTPNQLPEGIGPVDERGAGGSLAPPVAGAVAAGRPAVRLTDNTRVAAIELDTRLTGGYNADPRAGHEGVITVVHLRDVDGAPLAAAAPMSVVVLDPALSGDGARVARWDFTAEEVAQRYRKTPLSEGVHLEMVWPEALPIHGALHLFVRYTTDDGRRLQVDRPIEIDVPALQAQLPPLPSLTELPAQSADPPGALSERSVTSGEPTEQWQRRTAPAVEPPAGEPVRTSLLPKAESAGPAESATQPSAPKRRAPAWSPNRL